MLDREGLAQELWPRIDEAKAKARAILNRHHAAASRIFDWLVEHNNIDGETFVRLMRGDSNAR